MTSKLPEPVLDEIARLVAPLHPDSRDEFIRDAIAYLQLEPEPGLETANKIVRELLATGLYRRTAGLLMGDARAGPPRRIRRGKHGMPPADDAA
jgi:hypothetical protein